MSYDEIIKIGLREAQKITGPGDICFSARDHITDAGYKIDELDYDECRAALVTTSLYSCGKRVNVCSGPEIPDLQDRLGRLLLNWPPCHYFEPSPDLHRRLTEANELAWLRKLFVTAIKFTTNQWGVGPYGVGLGIASRDRDWGTPSNLLFGVIDPTIYLLLPLLEAVLKRALDTFVDADGNALQQFTVTKPDGSTETYAPQGQRGRSRCSSVGDLLCLAQNEFGNLGQDLSFIFDHLEKAHQHETPKPDWWAIIYKRWRNPALHGSSGDKRSAHIVLLNIVLLVALADAEARMRPVLVAAATPTP